jgi:hypothetical protein
MSVIVTSIVVWRPASLSWEWTVTRASRTFAHLLVPCDAHAFVRHFPACKHNVACVIMLAMLKEPSAIEAWADTGVMSNGFVRSFFY